MQSTTDYRGNHCPSSLQYLTYWLRKNNIRDFDFDSKVIRQDPIYRVGITLKSSPSIYRKSHMLADAYNDNILHSPNRSRMSSRRASRTVGRFDSSA